MIRLIIADDHPIVREGLKRIILECDDMEVIAEVSNGHDAITACREKDPDVLLLDITMPGPGILEIIRRVNATVNKPRILVLSIHAEESYAIRTVRAGASGYLTKNHSPEVLAEAIRSIQKGNLYVTPELSRILVKQLNNGGADEFSDALSDREFQVLSMFGEGKQVTEIARILSLSPKTISTYRNRLLKKLNLETTAELIKFSIENQITPNQDSGRPVL